MLTKPSFSTGYARKASESANPNWWTGLVGAWMPSLGVTGETLRDVSGNGKHITMDFNGVNGMTPNYSWRAGEKGRHILHDGVNDRLLGDDYENFSFGDGTTDRPFSIELLVKFDSFKDFTGIVSKDEWGPTREWTLGVSTISSNKYFRLFIKNQGGNNQQSVDAIDHALQIDKWYHVVTTYDGRGGNTAYQGMKIYVDAAPSSLGNIYSMSYTAMSNTSARFQIGNYGGLNIGTLNHHTFAGDIASTKIYNRALSPSEIKQLYLNPAAPFQKKTIVAGFVPKTFHKVAVLKKPEPSFVNGYARNASESARPHLWKGLIGAWIPNLGITSSSKVKNVAKNLIEDGTIKNGLQWSQNGFIQNDANEFIQLDNGYVTTEGTVVGSIDALGPLYTRYRQHEIWQSRNWGITIGGSNNTYLRTSKWDNSGGFKGVVYQNIDHAKSYHAASSFKDGDALKLYVNGAFIGETAYVSSQTQKGYTAKIASYSDQQPGQVDWFGPYNFGPVLLYNRVLSHSEIKELFIKPLAPFERKSTVVGAPAPPPPPVTNYKAVKVTKSHIKPSFKTGYARNASESANPNLWKGLVGAWMPSFGVTGKYLYDLSQRDIEGRYALGNGNVWNFDPAISWVVSNSKQGINLNGANQNIRNVVEMKREAFTIEVEFEWDDFNTNNVQFLTAGTLERLEIHLGGIGTNGVRFIPYRPYGYGMLDVQNAVTSGINHFVFTANHGETSKFYKNGALNSESSAVGSSNSILGQRFFYIGSRLNGQYHLDGKIFNVKIWNRVLKPSEIKQLYLNPLTPFEMKDTFAAYKEPLPPIKGLFRLP